MTMRKYLVTVHRDSTLTAVEYDEPSDYPNQYRPGTDELLRKGDLHMNLEFVECWKHWLKSKVR